MLSGRVTVVKELDVCGSLTGHKYCYIHIVNMSYIIQLGVKYDTYLNKFELLAEMVGSAYSHI